MTNKKIASEFAIGIILLLAIAIGGIFYWQNKEMSEIINQQPVVNNQQLSINTSKQQTSQMANPASVYCEQNGGKLEIRAATDGGQTGYCKFSDESECEEWAYFRKECKKGNLISKNNTSNWQTYKNEVLGIEFKYPPNFNIKENDVADFTDNTGGLSGKSLNISFDNMPIYISGFTPDYGTYFESSPNLSCKNPLVYDNRGEVCYIKNFSFGDVTIKNDLNEMECSIGFENNVEFANKSNSEYKLIRFAYMPEDINKKIDALYDCTDETKAEKAYNEAVFQSKNIVKNSNLSTIDTEYLEIFSKIVSTIKFIK